MSQMELPNTQDADCEPMPSTRPRPTVERRGRRGFAAMDPAIQKEIASKGGRAAHAQGTAHRFTSEEARLAGKKGGAMRRGRGPVRG